MTDADRYRTLGIPVPATVAAREARERRQADDKADLERKLEGVFQQQRKRHAQREAYVLETDALRLKTARIARDLIGIIGPSATPAQRRHAEACQVRDIPVLERYIRVDDERIGDGRHAFYRSHVERLASDLRVQIYWAGILAGTAWSAWKRIELPEPRTAQSYATCLHELGHVASPPRPEWRQVRRDDDVICPRAEVAAWEWAKLKAQPWIGEMQRYARRCLLTYLKYADSTERDLMFRFAYGAARIPTALLTVGELRARLDRENADLRARWRR